MKKIITILVVLAVLAGMQFIFGCSCCGGCCEDEEAAGSEDGGTTQYVSAPPEEPTGPVECPYNCCPGTEKDDRYVQKDCSDETKVCLPDPANPSGWSCQ
jgi:hypothetical protein